MDLRPPPTPPDELVATACEYCGAAVLIDSRGRCRNCGAPAPALEPDVDELAPGSIVYLQPGEQLGPVHPDGWRTAQARLRTRAPNPPR